MTPPPVNWNQPRKNAIIAVTDAVISKIRAVNSIISRTLLFSVLFLSCSTSASSSSTLCFSFLNSLSFLIAIASSDLLVPFGTIVR